MSVFDTAMRAKSLDHDAAQAMGVSPRTAKAYRLGERPMPHELRARLCEFRARRAIQLIEEGRAELARIAAEARAYGENVALAIEPALSAGRALHPSREILRAPSRRGDAARDDADAA
jgi:hypothetical protein